MLGIKERKRERESLAGRKKGEEGERVERKEEKEKDVEKNVTGWTLVTKSAKQKRRKVQISVKVDGGKTSAMEMEMSDKADDIVKKIPISDQDVYVTSGGRTLRGSDMLESCEVRDGSTVEVTSRMRGGGKHKDKKGKEEKKQVVQLDDGMCAIACDQLRLLTEGMIQGATEEDRRRIPGDIENARKVLAVVEERVKGEDVRRVAELEEGLKKLEEEMRPWSVEEQEQRRQEEQEHAAMSNAATSAKTTAATTTAVTSATTEAGNTNTTRPEKAKEKATEEKASIKVKEED